MRLSIAFLAIALLILTSTAFAQTIAISSNAVVPVILDSQLSSATNQIGDRFTAHCAAANCGGFPAGTTFVGTVTSVTRASGNDPGQIGVNFIEARLPSGDSVPITGMLTSLDPNAVSTDPNTGLMTGKPGSSPNRNAFIGYGAGAGLVIGAITGNALTGALIGAGAGWLYGATTRSTPAKDVVVPAGTQFGIMLTQPVNYTPGVPPAGAGPGEGPYYCPPAGAGPAGMTQLVFTGLQPYTASNGILMVPFRSLMDKLNQPFSYNAANNSVVVYADNAQIRHPLNSNSLYINDSLRKLSAPSRVIRGNLYVPAELVNILTGRTASWDASSSMLTIQ